MPNNENKLQKKYKQNYKITYFPVGKNLLFYKGNFLKKKVDIAH